MDEPQSPTEILCRAPFDESQTALKPQSNRHQTAIDEAQITIQFALSLYSNYIKLHETKLQIAIN
jgi:hypothetical protein